MLDAVFHEPTATYYVADVMCYRGHEMYDCSAEFRQFWLQSKLAEEGVTTQVSKAPGCYLALTLRQLLTVVPHVVYCRRGSRYVEPHTHCRLVRSRWLQ